jgi:hypothetical protein
MLVGIGIVIFTMYVILDPQPFSDQTKAESFRILLSLATGILGALVPGFLRVDWKLKGFALRAGTGMALFVITFFFAPKVSDKFSPTALLLQRFDSPSITLAKSEMNKLMTSANLEKWDATMAREKTSSWLSADPARQEMVVAMLRLASGVHECMEAGECRSGPICSTMFNELNNFYVSFSWYLGQLQPSYPNEVSAIRRFRSCDCFEWAKKKYWKPDGTGMKEWRELPQFCPSSIRASVRAWIFGDLIAPRPLRDVQQRVS